MSLTPISTPYTAEYKPLGLEAFAAPLSKMQEKFDVAKSEIDKTKYALSRMSQDDERAKKLLADLDLKTNELSENLTKTGNYRQAALKLQELNEWFNTNPEFGGMKSNYNNYLKNYELMQKKLEKGTITQDDFNTWDYYVKNKFKGTNYDRSSGTYTTGDFTPKSENREKEIEDLVLKIAALEEDQQVAAIQALNSSLSGAQIKQQLTKFRTVEDTQRSIKNFILTGDRFKNWKQEDAKMKFFELNDRTKKAALQGLTEDSDPLQFSKDVIKKSIPELQKLHDQVSKILAEDEKNNNLSKEERAEAEKIIEQTENKMGELYSILRLNDSDAIEQQAAGIYMADELGYFDKVALAGADVVDFIKEGAVSTIGGKNGQKLQEAAKVEKISTQINPVYPTKEIAQAGGSAPQIEEENLQLEPVEYTITDVGPGGEQYEKKVTIEPAASIGEAFQKNVDVLGDFKGQVAINKDGSRTVSYANTNDYILSLQAQNEGLSKTTRGWEEMYDQRISKLDDEIKTYKTDRLDPNLTDEEKMELDVKIDNARREKYQATYAKTSTLKDLDYLVTDYLHMKSDEELTQIIKDTNPDLKLSDEEILKSITYLKERFDKNTVSSPKFLDNALNSLSLSKKSEYKQNIDKLEKENKGLVEEASKEFLGKSFKDLTSTEQEKLENYLYHRIDVNEPGYDDLPEEVKENRQRLFERHQEIEKEVDASLNIVDNIFSPGELLLNKIYKDYRRSKTLGSKQYYQIPEVIIDDAADAFSSGEFKTLINQGMVERGNRNSRVFWDPSTRQSIRLDPAGLKHSYTLDAYRTDNPRYVGLDQYGNAIIAFYRKSALTDENKDLAGWKKYVDAGGFVPMSASTKKELESGEASYRFNADDLKRMQTNNPEVLYLSSEGLSMKPVEQITENFVDYIESASAIADPDARIEFIEKQRANYAPFFMSSNREISSGYYDFANTLRYRALNGIVSSTGQSAASSGVTSAPFKNKDGIIVTREYNARYETTEEGEIKVQYTEIIRNADNFEIVGRTDLPSLTISNQVNLPTALAKLDLTFGTGAAGNLKYTTKGGRRVPLALANLSPDVYKDPKRMYNIIN